MAISPQFRWERPTSRGRTIAAVADNGPSLAATNRDLGTEMSAGRFRADFYYRLCADMVSTPSLREQLDGNPDELPRLIQFITRGIAPEECQTLADEVHAWIESSLGVDYAWPGNFRELEQCVRNVLIRGQYCPPRASAEAAADLAREIREGSITAEQLIGRYCRIVHARTGSYQATANKLKLDRRTVKAKVLAEPA